MKAAIYVLQRFKNLLFCEAVQKYRITFTYVVPPILLSLARDRAVDRYDLSSLEAVLTGAAPAGPDLIQQFQERLKGVVVKQAYCLTEGSGIICVQREKDLAKGSAGVLVPGIQARVVDEKEYGFDSRGELLVKGPNIMKVWTCTVVEMILHLVSLLYNTKYQQRCGIKWCL
ncbi:hypothetical protein BDB00DRAFT_858134 [Zychaea mexicana]|uniref:uncharacterized protein n=1 Tax=Zychaea mexicana TaxID=64656 RepID=UPI0022FDB52A|nr:uncharacterized protein BDB00DRAFT_858134 [Zychaea mexicana]KAI9479611.1 hypothetical protein BDB00DRAFT_858134 [Zychaea mexicana]